ncbi:hypothetical protein BDR03DRAFT_408998 [Suillus americanus]|nr:hypothetical protein BDR03DRAFT_408998 [Suillus americanus]
MGRDLLRFSSNKKYDAMYYVGGNLNATYIRIPCRIACAKVNARTLGTHGLVGLSSNLWGAQ